MPNSDTDRIELVQDSLAALAALTEYNRNLLLSYAAKEIVRILDDEAYTPHSQSGTRAYIGSMLVFATRVREDGSVDTRPIVDHATSNCARSVGDAMHNRKLSDALQALIDEAAHIHLRDIMLTAVKLSEKKLAACLDAVSDATSKLPSTDQPK